MKAIKFIIHLSTSLLLLTAPVRAQATVNFVSPHADNIWIGELPIEVEIEGTPAESIQSLKLYLDNIMIREFTAPPYKISHDFGQIPINHTLRIVVNGNSSILMIKEIHSLEIDDMHEVDVTQIVVPVVVVNEMGGYVPGLRKNHFLLYEDDQPMEIDVFRPNIKSDFRLVLAIDISSSMKKKLAEVKNIAKVFLQKLLSGNDQAAVLFFNHELHGKPQFSGDTKLLSQTIDRATCFGATAMYDAIWYGLKMVRGFTGQTILILLSDGEDNSSYLDPYTLLKKVEKSNTTIYAIGKEEKTQYESIYQILLKKMSQYSGGVTFFVNDTDDIQRVYYQILTDIQSQYILQFTPKKDPLGKKFRKIKVKLTLHRGYQVRTIKGYYY